MDEKRPYRNLVSGGNLPEYDFNKIPKKRRKTSGRQPARDPTEMSAAVADVSTGLSESCTPEDICSGEQSDFVSTELVDEVDDGGVEIYSIELEKLSAVASMDGQIFVFSDFSFSTKTLQPFKLVIVKRKPAKFNVEGAFKWIYACSCDARMIKMFGILGSIISESYSDFSSHYPACIHVKSLQIYLQTFPSLMTPDHFLKDHDYATVQDAQAVHELPLGHLNAFVVVDGDAGVVTIDKCRLTCRTCSFGIHNCKHVKHIEHEIEHSGENTPEVIDNLQFALTYSFLSNESKLSPLSCEKLSFKTNGTLKPVDIEDGYCILSPNVNACSSCFIPLNLCEEASHLLFTRNNIHKAKVFRKKCSLCSTYYEYDGKSNTVLNMGKFLVHHEVLRDYMYHYLYGRCTMHTYYMVWSTQMLDMGFKEIKKQFPYRNFRMSWYAFLSLLDIDYKKGFTCETCQKNPDIIICDATSLAYRKMFREKPSELPTASPAIVHTSKHEDRVLLRNLTLRKELKRYSQGMASFQQNEFDELFQLSSSSAPFLVPLLQYCREISNVASPPEELRPLLSMLASSSPVCSYVNFSSHDVLNSLSLEKTLSVTILHKLQEEVPVLFELLHEKHFIPDYIVPIIIELVKISRRPFESSSYEDASCEGPCSSKEEPDKNQSGFFPAFVNIRRRRHYQLDSQRDKLCNKQASRHPSLLPGIFIVHCKHGICLGFKLMYSVESPDVPFTTLYEKFGTAPSVVVYDNACNLHSYCLNREPLFFQKTRFLVDRLHWKNHKCAAGYCLEKYPQYRSLNSQIVEQCNAAIKKLKSSLSYMNHDNFMNSLIFFLWYANQRKLGLA